MVSMVKMSSIYREVSLNMSMKSQRLDLWRWDIKSLSTQYKSKSAISGAQLVPIGIPTICWYTMPPNCTYIMFSWGMPRLNTTPSKTNIYTSHISCCQKSCLNLITEVRFWLSVGTLVEQRQHFCFDKQCGNQVYKVEQSKEDTWEQWQLRSRNFSMTSKSFNWPKIIDITISKISFTLLHNMIFASCKSRCIML